VKRESSSSCVKVVELSPVTRESRSVFVELTQDWSRGGGRRLDRFLLVVLSVFR